MTLVKQQCTAADAPRIFALISICFAHEHEYIEAVFPVHDTPNGRIAGAQRTREIMESDPNTSYWKIVDTQIVPNGSGNEIVAIAKWNVYDGVVPEETSLSGPWWKENHGDGRGDTEDERLSYADALFRGYLEERRRIIRESGGNLVSLDILVTDPIHQRRGAGATLVQHGIDIADKLGVEAVVEASVYGRHLYESKGFKMIRLVTVDKLAEKWISRPRQEFFWMVRPKFGSTSV